jgi:hypothetical protein
MLPNTGSPGPLISQLACLTAFQKMIRKLHPFLRHLMPEMFKDKSDTEHMAMEEGRQVKEAQSLEYRRTTDCLSKIGLRYEEYAENNATTVLEHVDISYFIISFIMYVHFIQNCDL